MLKKTIKLNIYLTYPLSKYNETKSFHVISLYNVLLYAKQAAILPPTSMARPVRLLNNGFLSPGVNLNSKPRHGPPPPPPELGPGVGCLGLPPEGGSFGGAGGR